MGKHRKHYTAQEKVLILRRHLVEKILVSELCDELGLQPTVFYRWQKEFFEHGVSIFERRSNGRPKAEQRKTLEAWVRAGTTPQRTVLRACICLLAADGWSNNAIAKELRTTRLTMGIAEYTRYRIGQAQLAVRLA